MSCLTLRGNSMDAETLALICVFFIVFNSVILLWGVLTGRFIKKNPRETLPDGSPDPDAAPPPRPDEEGDEDDELMDESSVSRLPSYDDSVNRLLREVRERFSPPDVEKTATPPSLQPEDEDSILGAGDLPTDGEEVQFEEPQKPAPSWEVAEPPRHKPEPIPEVWRDIAIPVDPPGPLNARDDTRIAVLPLQDDPFLVPPVVQIGSDPSRLDCVEIIFFPHAERHGFEVKAFSDRQLTVSEPVNSPICVEGLQPHRRFSAVVSGLNPGERFKYSVIHGGKVVFEAQTQARKPKGAPHRIVVTGDMGNGSLESARIAHRIFNEYRPDLLALTGDVVYMHGRMSEYLRRFFPVYNATSNSYGVGAPMLSEVMSFTSLGNHCVGKTEYFMTPSFDDFPDLYAYFAYWSNPLNGPVVDPAAKRDIPDLVGNKERIAKVLEAASERFPRMGNYSFDYGDVHWLVLDGNAYMDWTQSYLREWVEKDLIAAQGARWKFVNFHQPGFTSNPRHGREKRMRLLADLFQKHGVDIVFNGHTHYYERCYPLTFNAVPFENGSLMDEMGDVFGEIHLDKRFDGVTCTKPDGVIHIVTGAGGAKLDPTGIMWRPDEWKPFTHKLIADRHSFTVCDVDGDTLTICQIDIYGKEIDRLVVTK